MRRVAYMTLWLSLGCAEETDPARCTIPATEYLVRATLVASLCPLSELSAGTFYEAFTTGTRDYPGRQCSATRSLSEDACELTIEEHCESDAGSITHLTRYSLGSPDALTGTRETYVDFGPRTCSGVVTLQGTPR